VKKYVSLFLSISVIVIGILGITAQEKPVKITIIYDNTVAVEGLESDWGFACLIEGTEKTILFDTGTKSDLFLRNIEKLKIDPKSVELILISHDHGDHTGGLLAFLEKNNDVTVYLPVSFHDKWVERIGKTGAGTTPVKEPVEVCKGVYSTGELGTSIKEQGVILDTEKGLVVITGCAHPNIVNFIKRAKEVLDKEIYLVFGGFHLMRHSDAQMNAIIKEFRKLGVTKVGATHCTGPKQINMFRKEWGKDFVELGAGRVLTLTKDGLK